MLCHFIIFIKRCSVDLFPLLGIADIIRERWGVVGSLRGKGVEIYLAMGLTKMFNLWVKS